MKTVYVVCAAGVATSTAVRMEVEEYLRSRDIAAEVRQYRVTELSLDRLDADAIITTAGLPPEFAERVVVIDGVPLLTGIGGDEALSALAEALTSKGQ